MIEKPITMADIGERGRSAGRHPVREICLMSAPNHGIPRWAL